MDRGNLVRCNQCGAVRETQCDEYFKGYQLYTTTNEQYVICTVCQKGFMQSILTSVTKKELEESKEKDIRLTKKLNRSSAGREAYQTKFENGMDVPTLKQRLSTGFHYLSDDRV